MSEPFNQTRWVWMNGAMVSWRDANTHVSSHALHYGSGVFEGIRCYDTEFGPALFRLEAHLDRLLRSAELFGIGVPYSRADIEEGVCETVRANAFRDCYIRPICYYGSGSLSLKPNDCPVSVAILAWPWGTYLGNDGPNSGVRVTVSPWVRFNSRMVPTTAKICGAYINSILATREAASRGYDEAVLLDEQGYVAEGSVENIFVVRNGGLATNDEESSIVLGITRSSVMRIADDLGYGVDIAKLKVEDILSADEAFLTGTAAEVIPIREVDGRTIGDGKPGPITKAIQSVFTAAVGGRDQRYSGWLRAVGDGSVRGARRK